MECRMLGQWQTGSIASCYPDSMETHPCHPGLYQGGAGALPDNAPFIFLGSLGTVWGRGTYLCGIAETLCYFHIRVFISLWSSFPHHAYMHASIYFI